MHFRRGAVLDRDAGAGHGIKQEFYLNASSSSFPHRSDGTQRIQHIHCLFSMSATKTTWEDLSRLGWPKYDVYKKANEARDGTMSNEGDLYLNTGISADYQ